MCSSRCASPSSNSKISWPGPDFCTAWADQRCRHKDCTSLLVSLVICASIDEGVAASHRVHVPFEHHEMQAIGQSELADTVIQAAEKGISTCQTRQHSTRCPAELQKCRTCLAAAPLAGACTHPCRLHLPCIARSACSVSDALPGCATRPSPTGADSIDVMTLRRPTRAVGVLGSAWLRHCNDVVGHRLVKAHTGIAVMS